MLKLCDDTTPAIGTIAGGAVHEPYSLGLDSLWRHDSAKASLPRDVRVSYLREASARIVGGGI